MVFCDSIRELWLSVYLKRRDRSLKLVSKYAVPVRRIHLRNPNYLTRQSDSKLYGTLPAYMRQLRERQNLDRFSQASEMLVANRNEMVLFDNRT
jgi:hypothetical protein